MNKINSSILIKFLLTLFILFFFSVSCKTITVGEKSFELKEKTNLNANFIYLLQNENLTPIIYPISSYLIKPYSSDIVETKLVFDFDKNPPTFLKDNFLSLLEKIDPAFDRSLYIETKEYFSYILNSKDFTQMLEYLDKYINEKPLQPYPIEIGDFVAVYQNGIEYRYPLEKGATIIEFIDKSYQIKFADGRIFYLLSDGTYFETHEDGSEIYYVNPSKKIYRRWFGTLLFSKFEKQVNLQIGITSINLILNDEKNDLIKIKYSISNKFELYISLKNNLISSDDINNSSNPPISFFNSNFTTPVFNINSVKNLILDTLKNLSIVYDTDIKNIYFKLDNSLILIQSNLTKTIYASNQNESYLIKDIYLPEGIKLTDFDKIYGSGEVNFIYNFTKKSLGNFTFFYNKDLEPIVNKIDIEKLDKIQSILNSRLKWKISIPINVILPGDIYQFQQLLCGITSHTFSYLPDGFTRDDVIISWPLNLPRYYEDKEMKYFFEEEFYTLLLFQLTKKIMKQQVHFFGRIPFFIESALALYIASCFDEKLANSLESNYKYLMQNNFSFQGSLLVLTNPYSTPMPQTKLLSIFSYKLIKYLLSIYGEDKITSFIRAFDINFSDSSQLIFSNNNTYLELVEKKIIQIFGVTFEKLLETFQMIK